jgi:hypothetical protein
LDACRFVKTGEPDQHAPFVFTEDCEHQREVGALLVNVARNQLRLNAPTLIQFSHRARVRENAGREDETDLPAARQNRVRAIEERPR